MLPAIVARPGACPPIQCKRSLPGGVWEQVRQSNGSGYCPGTSAASSASFIHWLYLEGYTALDAYVFFVIYTIGASGLYSAPANGSLGTNQAQITVSSNLWAPSLAPVSHFLYFEVISLTV